MKLRVLFITVLLVGGFLYITSKTDWGRHRILQPISNATGPVWSGPSTVRGASLSPDEMNRQPIRANTRSQMRRAGSGRSGMTQQPRATDGSYFLSGRANTHSTEPPSGAVISGVNVASDLAWVDPLPTDTAIYCLPFTE